MKLRLNVATSPHENNRPFVAGAVFIGAIAFIALIILSHETYVTWQSNLQLRSDTARLEQQIRADEARQQELQAYFNRADVEQITARSEFLNSLISERSFPWTKIFMDLENTLPPGVRVVSIAPKLVNGRADVSLVVGASSDESKIRFLQAIEKSKNFSGVTVDDERVSDATADTDRITIRLDFWYATNT
jgi:Tfp pilus assembly protein PilN